MTKQLVDTIHEHLMEANRNWPMHAFSHAEGQAVYLERRLARCVGEAEVEHCVATVKENADGSIDYAAVLVTKAWVVTGELKASAERGEQRIPDGAVHVVPRSAIKGLTLHNVEYFGHDENEQGKDYVAFTAAFEGMSPVIVAPPGRGATNDGRTSRLFDAFKDDLG
ncbi:hypothetical protein [Arthrobacter sp. LFS091]|uniref:hypothetical protein n=1 Tax=Arthrobacter sp. LFS091 TaxID=3229892 RepID=UPI003A81053B